MQAHLLNAVERAHGLLLAIGPSRARSLKVASSAGRSDEGRNDDRRAFEHFCRRESLAVEGGDLASCFCRDNDPSGDIVGLFAKQSGCLKPIGGHERLFAAGASKVAEPAWQSSGIDRPQCIGADTDVVLIMKFACIPGREPLAVEPGAGTFDSPEQLVQWRNDDYTQDGFAGNRRGRC